MPVKRRFGVRARFEMLVELGVFAADFLDGVAGDGLFAGEHFVGDQTEGEDVGAFVERLAHDLFGGEVSGGAGEFGDALGLGGALDGEVEVANLGVGRARDEDVFGFEIEVEKAAFVDVGEAGGHAGEKFQAVLGDQWVAAQDAFFEVGAVDVFEDHVPVAAEFSSIEAADDVGVIEFAFDLAAQRNRRTLVQLYRSSGNSTRKTNLARSGRWPDKYRPCHPG